MIMFLMTEKYDSQNVNINKHKWRIC